jgi:hypothetical protein
MDMRDYHHCPEIRSGKLPLIAEHARAACPHGCDADDPGDAVVTHSRTVIPRGRHMPLPGMYLRIRYKADVLA